MKIFVFKQNRVGVSMLGETVLGKEPLLLLNKGDSTSFPNRLYANFSFFIIKLILDTTRRYTNLSQRR